MSDLVVGVLGATGLCGAGLVGPGLVGPGSIGCCGGTKGAGADVGAAGAFGFIGFIGPCLGIGLVPSPGSGSGSNLILLVWLCSSKFSKMSIHFLDVVFSHFIQTTSLLSTTFLVLGLYTWYVSLDLLNAYPTMMTL